MTGQAAVLLGILSTIAIGLASWALTKLVALTAKVAALEAQQGGLTAWMERIERKLDQVIAPQ